MPRLIDADEFKKENARLLHCDFPYICEETLEELIDEAPTVDAEPVKHGHWVGAGFFTAKCSVCDAELHDLEYGNYCPCCGAKMDEEEE